LLQLTALGLLAGAPAIPGAILGATVVNAELSALLLGVGVGAIAQVIVQITPALRPSSGQKLGPETIGAITAGVLVLYLTGLLVAACLHAHRSGGGYAAASTRFDRPRRLAKRGASAG